MNQPLRTRIASFAAACTTTLAVLIGLNAMFAVSPVAAPAATQAQLASATATDAA
jgi:hypothetical protein